MIFPLLMIFPTKPSCKLRYGKSRMNVAHFPRETIGFYPHLLVSLPQGKTWYAHEKETGLMNFPWKPPFEEGIEKWISWLSSWFSPTLNPTIFHHLQPCRTQGRNAHRGLARCDTGANHLGAPGDRGTGLPVFFRELNRQKYRRK